MIGAGEVAALESGGSAVSTRKGCVAREHDAARHVWVEGMTGVRILGPDTQEFRASAGRSTICVLQSEVR